MVSHRDCPSKRGPVHHLHGLLQGISLNTGRRVYHPSKYQPSSGYALTYISFVFIDPSPWQSLHRWYRWSIATSSHHLSQRRLSMWYRLVFESYIPCRLKHESRRTSRQNNSRRHCLVRPGIPRFPRQQLSNFVYCAVPPSGGLASAAAVQQVLANSTVITLLQYIFLLMQ